MDTKSSERLSAPAAQRNRQPILEVLARVLPSSGKVLEVASGTGEHAVWFAEHLSDLTFQPSDPDPIHRRSIEAWRQASGAPNLASPLDLDVLRPEWERDPRLQPPIAAVVCINMIHISPWEAALGLLRGAGRLLGPTAPLYLYGPYREGREHTAPSNAAFDASLRRLDPRFGVRDLEAVVAAADAQGFELEEVARMPANNLSVVLRRCRLPSASPRSA